jgi:hypothetical protein
MHKMIFCGTKTILTGFCADTAVYTEGIVLLTFIGRYVYNV